MNIVDLEPVSLNRLVFLFPGACEANAENNGLPILHTLIDLPYQLLFRRFVVCLTKTYIGD